MASSSPVQLSPSALLYVPLALEERSITEGPQLVVLSTWVFAQDAHIAKYVDKYRELFPGASILVVKCFLRHMFWIPAARRELEAAAGMIDSILGADTSVAAASEGSATRKPPMILHVFSNTGLSTSYNLCDAYAALSTRNGDGDGDDNDNDKRLPLHAAILDSTPGRYSFSSIVSAVMYGVPRGAGLQRLATLPLAHVLSGGLWVWVRVLRGQDWVRVWGSGANDAARTRETCRSYAYSAVDTLVESHVVEEHAREAQAKGFVVKQLAHFRDSPHVAHARTDPDRYWKMVKDTWEGL